MWNMKLFVELKSHLSVDAGGSTEHKGHISCHSQGVSMSGKEDVDEIKINFIYKTYKYK